MSLLRGLCPRTKYTYWATAPCRRSQCQLLLGGESTVTELVEALCYKPEGRRFDSRWGHWIFNLPNLSNSTMALGLTQPVTEMSNRNLPRGKGWRVGLTITRRLWAYDLEIVGVSTFHNTIGLKACYRNSFTFYPFHEGLVFRKWISWLHNFLLV
jgi:hypothetical protein